MTMATRKSSAVLTTFSADRSFSWPEENRSRDHLIIRVGSHAADGPIHPAQRCAAMNFNLRMILRRE